MSASATSQRVAAGTYGVDKVHSSIGFAVVHNGVTTFRSGFGEYEALLSGGDEPSLTGSVDVSSVLIDEPQLKGHLLSPEFFDVERHPQLRFESTSLSVADDGTVAIAGELEIHGQVHSVEAAGRYAELGEDAQGNARAGISLETKVDRRSFGLDWNADLPSGTPMLEWDVTINVELEFVKEGA